MKISVVLSIFLTFFIFDFMPKEIQARPFPSPIFHIENTWAYRTEHELIFTGKMAIDADGSPRAYHPDDIGIDRLENAGKDGTWWALVTENGEPLINRHGPYKGYYISTTTLEDERYEESDARRYVNAEEIPYFVLPAKNAGGAKLGDIALVTNTNNGKSAFAIYADVGPPQKIGEGSIKLAELLGVPSSPLHGGVDAGIKYVVFLGSGDGEPKTRKEIESIGAKYLQLYGVESVGELSNGD